MILPGKTYRFNFVVLVSGIGTAADALPVCTVFRNGSAELTTVDVVASGIAGCYKASFIADEDWGPDNQIQIIASATIATKANYIATVFDSNLIAEPLVIVAPIADDIAAIKAKTDTIVPASSGPYRLTISALDGVDLVPGVGLSIVGVSGTSRTTGTAGPVSIDLAAGEYLVRVSVPFGFAPVADVPVELPGPDDDVELSIDLESLTVTPPTAGNVCRVTLRVADESDAPWIDLPVFATLVSGPGVGLTLHANRGEPVLTDADGIATLDRLQGQVYDITAQRPDGVEITIRRQLPNAANADLSTLTVPS